MRLQISPYIHQHLLLSVFFIISILMGMKWYLIVASLIVNDLEHLLMCLLANSVL